MLSFDLFRFVSFLETARPTTMDDVQKRALDLVVNKRENIFLTGAAGTGKSFTIHEIAKTLRGLGKRVDITATTGVAAENIGGQTLHSWAGFGLGKHGSVSKALKVINKRDDVLYSWKFTDVLIIDEVSMLDVDYFCLLDKVGRKLRSSSNSSVSSKRDARGHLKSPSLPFGGIQLLLSGDFFQLPPISGRFIFEVDIWYRVVRDNVVVLEKVYRQQSDLPFVEMLMALRDGTITDEQIKVLQATATKRRSVKSGDICPTRLFCRRVDVASRNLTELSKLPGQEYVLVAQSRGKNNKTHNFRYPETIRIKVYAQVMLLQNMMSVGLVNGSRGVVVKVDEDAVHVHFMNGLTYPITRVEESSEDGKNTRAQFPLQLAWCITVHRAQGLSIDLLDVDMRGCFAPAQSYVALSRSRTLDGLRVFNFDRSAVKTSDKVSIYYNSVIS